MHMSFRCFKIKKLLLILIFSLSLIGCQNDPNKIANKANLYKQLHTTKHFIITSYARTIKHIDPSKPLYIYIEGDGQAWISKYKLSSNPTPRDPLTLKLASLDQRPNVIYIARPCQFTTHKLDHNCSSQYWSTARYSEPVVNSINEVVTNFKNFINNQKQDIHLIGYSGGATIAGIIASIRSDVKSLTTIAGNLDHDAVSEFHKTTKLHQSLNLINFAKNLSHIPQVHYIGENDQIIPIDVIKNFVTKVNSFNKYNNTQPKIANYIILKNIDHYHGWLAIWEKLYQQSLVYGQNI
jgi:hypothetical protein